MEVRGFFLIHRGQPGSAELCAAAHYSAGLSGDDRQPSGYMTITIVTISKIQNRSQTHKSQSLNSANSALPLLAVLVEKPDPRGEKRARERDQGKALASASSSSSSDLTLARQVRCDRPPRNLRHPSASFGTQFIESGAFLPL